MACESSILRARTGASGHILTTTAPQISYRRFTQAGVMLLDMSYSMYARQRRPSTTMWPASSRSGSTRYGASSRTDRKPPSDMASPMSWAELRWTLFSR